MIVYLLLNRVNRKAYVGQHRGCVLTKRWNGHLNNVKANRHLTGAIRKHGAESFTRTVLAYASCQDELDLLEKFFIQMYQSTNPRFGYNQQTGGLTGTGRHSKATIRQIREANRRHWEQKKPEERVQYSLNAWLRWDTLPEDKKDLWAEECRRRYWRRPQEERDRTIELVRKHTRGKKRAVPAWNKGLLGWNPRRHSSKREYMEEQIQKGLHLVTKPVTLTKVQTERERRAMAALKEAKQAAHQLREIKQRLNDLRFELQGGCNW